MSTPSDQQPKEAAFFTTIRSWGISRGDHGVFGGVIAGLGPRIGLAVVPARIITVVLAVVLNGLVLIAYAAAWALLPDRRGNIVVQNFGRGIPNVGALIGIAIFSLVGLGSLNDVGPLSRFDFPSSGTSLWHVAAAVVVVAMPLAVLAGLVALIIFLAKRGGQGTPQPQGSGAAVPGGQAFAETPAQAAQRAAQGNVASDTASAAMATASATASATAEPGLGEGLASDSSPTADAQAATPAQAPAPSTAPAYTAPAYSAPAPIPPAPRAPRVPGPGRGFYLLWLAWTFISAAGVGWAYRNEQLAVHPVVAWFAVYVTGLGAILILVSLSGRKLGFLGFLGIVLALPTAIIAAGADSIRDSWTDGRDLITVNINDAPAPYVPFDATASFAKEYQLITINGTCNASTDPVDGFNSVARLTYPTVSEDTSVDVTAEVTRVQIPADTNLKVTGVGNAQATVIWPQRNLTCYFQDAGGNHLELSNPGLPTLDLVVKDDAYQNIIVVTEVKP